VNEFQLLFRGNDGEPDRKELRFNDTHGEPKIDGRLVVEGETYTIRGIDWLLSKDVTRPGEMQRFVCTLVVEPTAE
jgi:hypothetical protein